MTCVIWITNLGCLLVALLPCWIESNHSNRVSFLSSPGKTIPHPPPTNTYASVVGSEVIQGNASGRLERLEFSSSEDDRKNKLLHVQVTHPSLDPSSPSLLPHVQNLLKHQHKMTDREIDANMLVFKSSRPNTVTIKCSDRRFKLFIYCARKKLRSEN